mgnify:CR=1 FL=1
MITLYHGTNQAFDTIDLQRGLPNKDFGRGFYLTDSLECAVKTARQRVDRLGGSPKVLAFGFDEEKLALLNVKRFTVPSREWALFVRANRRDYVDADDHNRDNRYDLVVGPIANDKLSLQFRLFDKGIISLDDFVDGLKFRQVYMQYSFHTNRAVELLEFGEVKDVG